MKFQVADLFSGVGGMSLGASRAGFEVKLAVELDEQAIESHAKNFPNTVHLQDDVSLLSGDRIGKYFDNDRDTITGIIGGPPCQGFSSIGRRESRDSRNSLFRHFFRIVNEVSPHFFIAENVPGILNTRFNSSRSRALSLVREKYQLSKPVILVASDYGAPTSRKRVFFLGIRKDFYPDTLKILPSDLPFYGYSTTVGEALAGLPLKINPSWQEHSQGIRRLRAVSKSWFRGTLAGNIPNGVGNIDAIKDLAMKSLVSGCLGTRHTDATLSRLDRLAPGEKDPVSKGVRLRRDGLCPTLRAGTGNDRGSYQAVRPIHFSYPRVITPREAARLQSFPDWFQFHTTKWHSFRQIGNSIPPLLAESLLTHIKTQFMVDTK